MDEFKTIGWNDKKNKLTIIYFNDFLKEKKNLFKLF